MRGQKLTPKNGRLFIRPGVNPQPTPYMSAMPSRTKARHKETQQEKLREIEHQENIIANCISFVTNPTENVVVMPQTPGSERVFSALLRGGAEFASITVENLKTEMDIGQLCELIQLDTNIENLKFVSADTYAFATRDAVAAAMRNGESLETVTFERVTFSSGMIRLIAYSLPFTRLKSLAFRECKFDDNSNVLLCGMALVPSLEDLAFESSALGPEGMATLPSMLPELINLRRITIRRQTAGTCLGRELGLGFAGSCSCPLVWLDLSEIALRNEGIDAVVCGLMKYYSESNLCQNGTGTLQHLDLHNNEIGEPGGRKIAELVRHNPAIEYIDISRNIVGGAACSDIGVALLSAEKKSLNYLNVSVCAAGQRGIVSICRSLAQLTGPLTLCMASGDIWSRDDELALSELLSRKAESPLSLDLSNNDIGTKGARTLAEGLATSRSVERLTLEGNFLLPEGACAVISAAPTDLRELCLCSCEIGDRGAEALGRLRGLEKLCVRNNKIGPDGIGAICEAARRMGGLVELDLAMNPAGQSGAVCIATRLIRHDEGKVQELDIAGMETGDQGEKEIASAIMSKDRGSAVRRVRVGDIGGRVEELRDAKRKVAPAICVEIVA